MHTALHYLAITEEYGMASNYNVLIGEDKHRFFKQVVYNTNHQKVEKELLSKENMRLTLRLILANAFNHDEPQLTAFMNDLYTQCPTLFSTMLPKSEHTFGEENYEADEDDDVQVVPDAQHIQPTVIGCIKESIAGTLSIYWLAISRLYHAPYYLIFEQRIPVVQEALIH